MVTSEKTTMSKLTGGVLVIGSLLWDNNKLREKWRNDYLNIDEIKDVKLPIRYGKLSETRDSSYTMVFSSECLEIEKMGNGKFIPFKNNPLDFDSLNTECIELIKAEKKKHWNENRYNWAWGTVAIMFNPKIFREDNSNYNLGKFFLKKWKNKIGNRFNKTHYKVADENPILDENAILNFDWPKELDNYDFFIATSNKPKLEKYPTSKEIAEKIIETKNDYFLNNIKYNINTFQDALIKEDLKMKPVNLTIKKTFLKYLLISFIVSVIIFFILVHFGDFYFYADGFSYEYRNYNLGIEMFTGVFNYPSEYLEKLKIYMKVLFSYHSIIPLLCGTGISLLVIYLFKLVKIKVE